MGLFLTISGAKPGEGREGKARNLGKEEASMNLFPVGSFFGSLFLNIIALAVSLPELCYTKTLTHFSLYHLGLCSNFTF